MRVQMQDFADGSGTLATAILGQRVFAELAKRTKTPAAPEVCFLDFSGVAVATGSFLREGVIAYRDHVRRNWRQLYPVAANMVPVVAEEFEVLLTLLSDAFVVCDLQRSGKCVNPKILGKLDDKQVVALNAVLRFGEADAPRLAEAIKETPAVQVTAWNNRLVALANKGVLVEATAGRGKKYRPVIEGLNYGT